MSKLFLPRYLEKLRGFELGKWKKIYQDGINPNGDFISIHYIAGIFTYILQES